MAHKELLKQVVDDIIKYLDKKGWQLTRCEYEPKREMVCGMEDERYTLDFQELNSKFVGEDYDLSDLVVKVEYCDAYDDTGDIELDEAVVLKAFICQDLGSFEDTTEADVRIKNLSTEMCKFYKLLDNWVRDDFRQMYVDELQ